MESRRLTSDDLPEFLDLVLQHTKMQRSDFDASTLDLEKTFDQYYGSFNDEVMVSATRVAEFKSQPAYLIGPYYLKRNLLKTFSWKPESGNPAQSFWEAITTDMAKKGRYTAYYTRSIDKWPERMRRNGRDFFSALGIKDDWVRYIEEIVPAGKRSQYELHDAIMMKREWPVAVMVVKICMRNSMRNHLYKLEEDDN